MLHNDLIMVFIVIGILFLRQIVILKNPNKINYAPLVLGIGAIGTIVHFILHTRNPDVLFLVRESLFPFLFALILYVIMNILHQTQQSQFAKTQEEFIQVIPQQMNDLKNFLLDIEKRITISRDEDKKFQEEIRKKFKEDKKALDTIQLNQVELIKKLELTEEMSNKVNKSFHYFGEVKLPELDNIIHRHIDILRVAEQDHYKKLQHILNEALENKFNFSDAISQDIISKTSMKLSALTKSFEEEILFLKSHAGSINRSLSENEATLANMKTQSEMIIEQIILSAKNMQELDAKTEKLPYISSEFNTLIKDIEAVKSDYITSQSQLNNALTTFENAITESLQIMNEKLNDSLLKLDEYYTKIDKHNKENVNLLAKKAQLKKGYGNLDDQQF